MCLKDDANSHLSGSLLDDVQQLRNCSPQLTGKVNEVMRVTKNWLLIGFELGPLVGNVKL